MGSKSCLPIIGTVIGSAVIVDVEVIYISVSVSVIVVVSTSGARFCSEWSSCKRSLRWRTRSSRSTGTCLSRRRNELAVGSSAAAVTSVGVNEQVGSLRDGRRGWSQLAVWVTVDLTISAISSTTVTVAAVMTFTLVTGVGVTVTVCWIVVDGSVTVDWSSVVVIVSSVVLLESAFRQQMLCRYLA